MFFKKKKKKKKKNRECLLRWPKKGIPSQDTKMTFMKGKE